MNRRAFLASLGAVAIAPMVVAAVPQRSGLLLRLGVDGVWSADVPDGENIVNMFSMGDELHVVTETKRYIVREFEIREWERLQRLTNQFLNA